MIELLKLLYFSITGMTFGTLFEMIILIVYVGSRMNPIKDFMNTMEEFSIKLTLKPLGERS